MKWIYGKEDLKRILCAGLDVKEMKFDDKKKELTITLEMPDPKARLKELKELTEKIKNSTTGNPKAPGNLYQ